MIRTPELAIDGWCLEDGEQRHKEAPSTFLIPDIEIRKFLEPGDFAKLIFTIAVTNETEPLSTERMWVIVRERIPGGYLGMLDNEPHTITKNDFLWRGTELPFEPRHIIGVDHGNADSKHAAAQPVPIPWISD